MFIDFLNYYKNISIIECHITVNNTISIKLWRYVYDYYNLAKEVFQQINL